MVTTFEQETPPSAPGVSGGSGSTGGSAGQFAVEIEHQIKKLINDAKQEGVPIIGHVLEGMDNVGDGGGQAPDPFTQLFSSGFGWMIDSVGFLREPIDKLDGDAAAAQTAVDSMKHVTENLTFTARGHRDDLPTLADWQGEAADAFRASMELLGEEILSLARVVEGLGTLTAVSSSMVITLRKIVRDLVATALGSIVIIMIAAVAAAFVTLGTSVMAGVATSVAVAVGVMIESTRRITMLMDALGRQAERMGDLEAIAGDIADALKRFEEAAGLPSTDRKELTKNLGGSGPENGTGNQDKESTESASLGRITQPDEEPPEDQPADSRPGQNDTDPDHWNGLRDKADEKLNGINDRIAELQLRSNFGGLDSEQQRELADLEASRSEWEGVRDGAETRSEDASKKRDQQELDQAKSEIGMGRLG